MEKPATIKAISNDPLKEAVKDIITVLKVLEKYEI